MVEKSIFPLIVACSLACTPVFAQDTTAQYSESGVATTEDVREMYLNMLRQGAINDKAIITDFLKNEFGLTAKEARGVLAVAKNAGEPMSQATGEPCEREVRVSNGYTKREVYSHIVGIGESLSAAASVENDFALRAAAGDSAVDAMYSWAQESIAPKIHSVDVDTYALLENEDVDIDKFADNWCDSVDLKMGEWK